MFSSELATDGFRIWESDQPATGKPNPLDRCVGIGLYSTIQGTVKGPARILTIQCPVGVTVTLSGSWVGSSIGGFHSDSPAQLLVNWDVPPGECVNANAFCEITYEVINVAKLQFGKYSGQDIENVPVDYLEWLKTAGD